MSMIEETIKLELIRDTSFEGYMPCIEDCDSDFECVAVIEQLFAEKYIADYIQPLVLI